tara:strand:+ start:289 stop:549 length:261 start_codon:yes stop_codon:yes gene_type:complete
MSETVDDVLDVDISELTVGEIIEIEELTGMPLDALGQADKPKGKMLAALAFVSKRRENPKFTWEDALELKITTSQTDVDPSEGDES